MEVMELIAWNYDNIMFVLEIANNFLNFLGSVRIQQVLLQIIISKLAKYTGAIQL